MNIDLILKASIQPHLSYQCYCDGHIFCRFASRRLLFIPVLIIYIVTEPTAFRAVDDPASLFSSTTTFAATPTAHSVPLTAVERRAVSHLPLTYGKLRFPLTLLR
jgi:hypothetical protein